jgi:hypothetical protein
VVFKQAYGQGESSYSILAPKNALWKTAGQDSNRQLELSPGTLNPSWQVLSTCP